LGKKKHVKKNKNKNKKTKTAATVNIPRVLEYSITSLGACG
jgi:predicted nucleotide-binding protein (sugar kinase/HSP70/actin superfamily)